METNIKEMILDLEDMENQMHILINNFIRKHKLLPEIDIEVVSHDVNDLPIVTVNAYLERRITSEGVEYGRSPSNA